MGGLERLAALALHIACSLVVLVGVRANDKRWLGASIAAHAGLNTVVVLLTKATNPFVAEAVLVVLAVALLLAALRRAQRG